MFRLFLTCSGVLTALALRRGGSRLEGTRDKQGVADVILSLLETAEGLERRSNQQSAARVLEALTPGVKSNLTAIAAKLRNDVIKKIELGHSETQTRLDQEVKTVGNKASLAATKKEEADEADRDLQGCIETEKGYLQAVVEAENLYNKKTEETVEPCLREEETASISVTAEKFTINCETDKDPNCTAAISELEKKLDDMKATLTGKIQGKVESHKTAEKDCGNAVDAKTAQQDAATKAQATWDSEHDNCVGSRETRDQKICSFGEQLQEVCAATASYGELVSSTRGSGSVDSVQDRVAEWNTTQLALCLLESFNESSDLTAESVEKCQAKITIEGLDLDEQASKVQTSLDVPSSPTFRILCEEQEPMTFHGGIWKVPEEVKLSEGYDGQVPSIENVTLPQYVFQESWSTKVTLKAGKSPFAECPASKSLGVQADKASSFRSLRVQADKANALHHWGTSPYWNVGRLVITDSLGAQATWASDKLQFPRESGKDISCKVEYSGAVDAFGPFHAAINVPNKWGKWSGMSPDEKIWFEISDCDAALTLQSVNITQQCYAGQNYYRMSQVEVLSTPALSEKAKKTSKDTVSLQGCDGDLGTSGQEVLANKVELASATTDGPL